MLFCLVYIWCIYGAFSDVCLSGACLAHVWRLSGVCLALWRRVSCVCFCFVLFTLLLAGSWTELSFLAGPGHGPEGGGEDPKGKPDCRSIGIFRRSVGRLFGWLVDWLVGWLTSRSLGRLVGQLIGWSVGRSVARSVDQTLRRGTIASYWKHNDLFQSVKCRSRRGRRSVNQSNGWLVDQPNISAVNRLVSGSIDRSVGRSIGQSPPSVGRMVGRSVGRSVGWSVGRSVGQYIRSVGQLGGQSVSSTR